MLYILQILLPPLNYLNFPILTAKDGDKLKCLSRFDEDSLPQKAFSSENNLSPILASSTAWSCHILPIRINILPILSFLPILITILQILTGFAESPPSPQITLCDWTFQSNPSVSPPRLTSDHMSFSRIQDATSQLARAPIGLPTIDMEFCFTAFNPICLCTTAETLFCLPPNLKIVWVYLSNQHRLHKVIICELRYFLKDWLISSFRLSLAPSIHDI